MQSNMVNNDTCNEPKKIATQIVMQQNRGVAQEHCLICYEGSAKYIGVITSSAEVFVLGLDYFAHVYMPKIAISIQI